LEESKEEEIKVTEDSLIQEYYEEHHEEPLPELP